MFDESHSGLRAHNSLLGDEDGDMDWEILILVVLYCIIGGRLHYRWRRTSCRPLNGDRHDRPYTAPFEIGEGELIWKAVGGDIGRMS